MSLIQSKQVNKLLQAGVHIAAVPFAAASSDNIAAALATAAAISGDGGSSVPLQVSSATTPGFVAVGNNLVQVWDASQKKISDAAGNEVFGRLTNAGAVWTLSLYTLVGGVETAYTLSAAANLIIEVTYLFTFMSYPREAAAGVSSRVVNNDPNATSNSRSEAVTVTAVNTLASLTNSPDTGKEIVLVINGQDISSLSLPVAFTVAGAAVTWNASNAGFALATSDSVVARYFI